MAKFYAIIAAAGSGSRMKSDVPKQYMNIDGEPMIVKSVRAFCDIPEISCIYVICPVGDEEKCKELLFKYMPDEFYRRIIVSEGGRNRRDSVAYGVSAALRGGAEFVLVHDGARPFVSREVIDGVMNALKAGSKAAIPCVRPKNTIRTAEQTLDRSSLYEVQTPQGIDTKLLQEAYAFTSREGFNGTDEASLIERLGEPITITEGSYSNIKITTREDIPMEVRCGNGYDVHKLVEGRRLMLGCTEIPFEKGLLGHSDGDVCAHAIADAVLGAAGLRDIGYYFPDDSPRTLRMAGALLLSDVRDIIKNEGFTIVNVDATIVAQVPKLSPYIEEMRESVAYVLGIAPSSVGIKATTEEGLGVTGTGEAISCFATATVK